MTAVNITNLNFDVSDTESLLKYASQEYGDKITLAMSFSKEDIVILHYLYQMDSDCKVFALDTGRLPEETYKVADKISQYFDLKIDWYFPDNEKVEALIRSKGNYSFRESVEARKTCCHIRKVEPLKRALADKKAWITGQRREHAPSRHLLDHIEKDNLNKELIKINPLAHWTYEEVCDYVQTHRLPYNSLYDKGYVSIGCAPCSRPVKAGENLRAGRWWWEEGTNKECGLHDL